MTDDDWSDLESFINDFGIAVTESLAPIIRKSLHGEEIKEDEMRERLEYQLRNRGFDIENKSNKTETDTDIDTDAEQETDE